LKKGRIIKLIGGLYTVLGEDKQSYVLKPRGVFRHNNLSPKVGDIVVFNDDVITELMPRENELVRPPIANIDQAILINSARHPHFSFNLLDRFLTLIENEDITPIIVVTKIDLMEKDKLEALKKDMTYYETFYEVYYTSTKTNYGMDQIRALFTDKVSVFAGQTGAGKSSLLNAIDLNLNIKTDDISYALGRGKHTTRHSELITINGGLVADTPGFSKLDFYDIPLDNVPMNFVDFFELSRACKFNGCTHINEPGCNVKKALREGKILKSRYNNYLSIYEEIKSQKKY
jgi:ribosome biogenesis GTPase